ncbi:FtsW/RodA/SpoVE family cell cycle protein [Fusicatenibacter faecihominis]|uniref:FtsW/RodA/SpoVE family cell cycle protein n=1 Tax=Fusicatenibacter faecihominis TaxID=2881276 RepID=A0AAE3J4U7_9FIRM|nr:FtsW/RodA/SpoVE family cell cycle protein [Fusicatenibacter faecihominis]MCC2188579.1 FtsW/RodA/SpoVE family cell cycle protein [Fusicatenibacter faecihominis]
MTKLIIDISKYVLLVLIALYALQSYIIFKKKNEDAREFLFLRQNVLMFAIHFIAFTVFYLKMDESTLFYFYGAQAIYLGAVLVLFRNLYPRASKLLVNNMCMLITIGFIMLTRISYDQSMKQFKILAIATVAALIIPILVKKLKFLDKLGYIYALGGIGLLGVVLVFAKFSYGSKLSLSIGGFTFQPSEFVKIIFVFAVASLLAKATDFKHVVITTAIAGAHVLILVVSKDLGSALIFFVTYLVMLYVGTRDWRYLFLGIAAGVIASVAAYFLFSHVRVRVQVWKDPFASYTGDGYQVAQSLFAIGAGGWFGTGLYQGSPTMIPIVEQDFMFSAICEELGGFFAICLILIYMSCFIMFVNIAFKMENKFARLASLGLGCTFSVQVFLTVGGAMKMIPSTGVTLPFISYGGSSIMSTVIMFAIVQGFYISRREERGEYPDGEYGYYDEYGNFYPGPDGYAPYGYDENGYPYPYPKDGHENGYPYEGDGYGYPENGYDNGYPYQENGYMPYQQVGYDENFPDPQNSGPDLYAPDRGYGMNEYDEETDGSEEESNEKERHKFSLRRKSR